MQCVGFLIVCLINLILSISLSYFSIFINISTSLPAEDVKFRYQEAVHTVENHFSSLIIIYPFIYVLLNNFK